MDKLLCIEQCECIDRASRDEEAGHPLCIAGILLQSAFVAKISLALLASTTICPWLPGSFVVDAANGGADVHNGVGSTNNAISTTSATVVSSSSSSFSSSTPCNSDNSTSTKTGITCQTCTVAPLLLGLFSGLIAAVIIYLHVLRNLRIKDEEFVLEMARKGASSFGKDLDHTISEFGDAGLDVEFGDVGAAGIGGEAGINGLNSGVSGIGGNGFSGGGSGGGKDDFFRILAGCLFGSVLFVLLLDLNVPFSHFTLCIISSGAGIFAYLKTAKTQSSRAGHTSIV